MDNGSVSKINAAAEELARPPENRAYLSFRGHEVELPIVEPVVGAPSVDIGALFIKHNILTFDPSFKSTAACRSAITYIDGDKGELWYRGYPIEQLAQSQSYLATCHLLWSGELPSREQEQVFERQVKSHTLVHERLRNFFQGFPDGSHPMSMMCGVIGALSAFYHDSLDISSSENRELSMLRLVAKMPTIAAMSYKHSVGQPFMYPRNELSYVENFLYMMFGLPSEPYVASPIEVKALETILILHADHEQNASTSTVRIAGSSLADPFACMAAGITALWGPSHGGANQAVIEMLQEIGDVSNIPACLARAKDKSSSFKLMGFGHRVYKNFDPRAGIIKKLYEDLLKEKGIGSDPLFEIAKELERIALSDEYFISRKLYPNVDFYSGLILRRMNIPTSMFTVIFAMARVIGWISHWNEMIEEAKGAPTIARPRQIYTGPAKRNVTGTVGSLPYNW